ncbi:MAG: amidohydrolase [Anaerovoracaceae bacterium]
MLFKNITLLNEEYKIIPNSYIGIVGNKIEYIGTSKPSKDYGYEYDGRNKLLMPGFVNSHGHSPMTLLRGYGENLGLQDWLNKKVFPFEDKLTGESVYYGTLLAMAESIRYGIVSTTDMYYFSEAMAKAIGESGTKNNISRSITNFADEDLDNMESAKEMKWAYENLNGTCDGRIIVDMSLHAEYTSTPKTVKQLADYTKKIGANMHVHLSETKFEHEECKKKYGMTPTEYLNHYGLFDTKTTAAHCVHLEEEDFKILKEKGVTVACNPISNLKLASGICNVPKLLKQGINVTIGTDSVASNNSLNFIEEMKMFAIAPKMMFNSPEAVTPIETIKAATINGAVAQGRYDTGIIKEGYKADLIVIDISGPNMHPIHNLANNVVYSASSNDVVLTMVDGKVLYENGEYKTIDIEKVIYNVEKITKDIINSL